MKDAKNNEKFLVSVFIISLVLIGYWIGYVLNHEPRCFLYLEQSQKIFNQCTGEVSNGFDR